MQAPRVRSHRIVRGLGIFEAVKMFEAVEGFTTVVAMCADYVQRGEAMIDLEQ